MCRVSSDDLSLLYKGKKTKINKSIVALGWSSIWKNVSMTRKKWPGRFARYRDTKFWCWGKRIRVWFLGNTYEDTRWSKSKRNSTKRENEAESQRLGARSICREREREIVTRIVVGIVNTQLNCCTEFSSLAHRARGLYNIVIATRRLSWSLAYRVFLYTEIREADTYICIYNYLLDFSIWH